MTEPRLRTAVLMYETEKNNNEKKKPQNKTRSPTCWSTNGCDFNSNTEPHRYRLGHVTGHRLHLAVKETRMDPENLV